MYVYNDISLNVSLIRKHTVIKVERVDEWNLKRRACTVKDQRPSPKKKILRRWWKSRTSLERISIQIIKAVKLTGELNSAEFLKRLTFHGCWKDLACLQNCKGLYGKNAGRQSMRMQSNNFLHSVRTDIHVSYSGPGFFFLACGWLLRCQPQAEVTRAVRRLDRNRGNRLWKVSGTQGNI